MPETPIVIIGPMAAGKSTVAHELALRTGLLQVPFDAVRFYYYLKLGFTFAEQLAQPDFRSVAEYWRPFHLPAAEALLAEFDEAIIDFGAGHAHFEDEAEIARLERILAPVPNVILLMPSEDPVRATEISVQRDRERLGDRWDPSRADMAGEFVRSESFRRVAKQVVVTEGLTIAESVDRVMAVLR